MNPKNNKEDIEELNFDDVELEIKLDNNDLKLDLELDNDNSGAKTSSDSNLNESSDSIGSESSSSQPNEAPSQDASGSENLPASTGENDSSDNTPSENDDVSSSSDNNSNAENDLSEANDESLSDKEDQEAKDDSSKEENKDSEDKNNKGDNEDKKNSDNKDEKSDENKDTNADDKKESDNKNDKGTDKKDSQNDSNEKDDKNPKGDNKPKDKENNNGAPNKDNNEPKSGLDKKRDDLKNQRDNKPKPGKDSKPGLKDKGKNFGKNLGNNLKNGAKNKAKDALNNSKAGHAVNKTADAANKAKNTAKAAKGAKKIASSVGKGLMAFFKTPAGMWTLIGIAAIIGLILLGLFIYAVLVYFFPNLGGPVEDEENYSKYSTVDQKTITNLRKLSDRYAGDPSYAMVATIYPYIEELHGGNVNSLKGKSNEELEDDVLEDDEDVTTEGIEEDAKDDENDLREDDPYLELLRKRYYLNKFKKLLKKSMDGEDSLTNYLKETYFKSDKGYKELFNGTSNEEELANAIIDDLLSLKDDFNGYFFESRNCTVNLTSVGTVEIDELLKSNILVDVKEDSCTKASDCTSWHTNPISLKDYILGVVWTEKSISTSSDFEQVKAQMIAAKAYALGRHRDLTKKTDDGSYVITMLSNTNDQDYCDYTIGCPDNKRSGNKHTAASSEVITLLEQAWEETKNVYVYDETKKSTVGSYCANRSGVCEKCTKGSCMSQTELSAYSDTSYSQILGDQYSKYSIITVEGDYAEASVASGTTCSAKGYGIPDNQFKFYYQTDYPDKPFCAATDGDFVSGCPKDGGKNSICTSGCGATSYAMLISNLSDTEFDPVAANAESASIGGCATGSGTYDKLFTSITSHEGFTIEKLSNDEKGVSNAISALKNGALIAANVQANSDFTSGGHWILLRGLTEDNMVKVADPNSKERSLTGTYSINKFIDENWLIDKNGTAHSWYAIYGPKSEEIKSYSNLDVEGEASGTLGYPVEGVTGCDASDYPNYSGGKYHGGTDINSYVGAFDGMNILAADGGTVKTVKNLFFSYGSHVIIDHGNGYTTLYAHMQKGSIVVKEGDKIAKGQLIGKLGSTGNSTGPHLHIELRKDNNHNNTLNPCTYIGTNKSYVND